MLRALALDGRAAVRARRETLKNDASGVGWHRAALGIARTRRTSADERSGVEDRRCVALRIAGVVRDRGSVRHGIDARVDGGVSTAGNARVAPVASVTGPAEARPVALSAAPANLTAAAAADAHASDDWPGVHTCVDASVAPLKPELPQAAAAKARARRRAEGAVQSWVRLSLSPRQETSRLAKELR